MIPKKYEGYKIVDPHVHTWGEIEEVHFTKQLKYLAVTSPKEVSLYAKKKGVDTVVVTDNSTIKYALQAREQAVSDIDVIIGREFKVKSEGIESHVTVFPLTYESEKKIESLLAKKATIDELVDCFNSENLIYILAHPFIPAKFNPSGGYDSDKKVRKDFLAKFMGLETISGSMSLTFSPLTDQIATDLNLAKLGVSDAHYPDAIGNCHTLYQGDLYEAIRKKQTIAEGVGFSFSQSFNTVNSAFRANFQGLTNEDNPALNELHSDKSKLLRKTAAALLPFGYVFSVVASPFVRVAHNTDVKVLKKAIDRNNGFSKHYEMPDELPKPLSQ